MVNLVIKNATGPPENKNEEKHGFFSKWLPEETMQSMQTIQKADPLDILWDNIQLQYAAIIRAQKLMYVKDQQDMTTTKVVKDTVIQEVVRSGKYNRPGINMLLSYKRNPEP